MLRRACARRGGAAEQPGVQSEWDVALFLSKVMIAVKSHFTSHCRVCKSASAEAHPRTSAPLWAQAVCLALLWTGPAARVSGMKSRGARLRATVPGQTLTASTSLVANSLSIAEAMHPAFLRGSRLHPCGWSKARLDHSSREAVGASSQSCWSRTNGSSLSCVFALKGFADSETPRQTNI